jgi:hypothetical protein
MPKTCLLFSQLPDYQPSFITLPPDDDDGLKTMSTLPVRTVSALLTKSKLVCLCDRKSLIVSLPLGVHTDLQAAPVHRQSWRRGGYKT